RKKGIDPELAAGVLTQSRLRAKGETKFGEFASGMLFTQHGLEQATRLSVAALHAQRFRAAGIRHVADLTSGIGADAMAMASLGLDVLAIDNDEATAAIATVNLRHFPSVKVVHADSLTYSLPDSVGGLWADPARRSGNKRVFNPKAFTQPLDDILALRDSYPALGMKLAPGLPHEALPENAETQWISANGTVVEAAVWCGPLAAENITRSALILPSDTDQSFTLITDADPAHREQVPAGEVGTWVHEPDGAVIRAGLVG